MVAPIGEVDWYIVLLRQGSRKQRQQAAFELGELGELARPAVPTLLATFSDPDHGVRWNAGMALHLIEWSGDPPACLMAALVCSHAWTRDAALIALGGLNNPSPMVIRAIARRLADRHAVVRWCAGDVFLHLVRNAEDIQKFLTRMYGHRSDQAKVRAAEALWGARPGLPAARLAALVLLGMVKDRTACPTANVLLGVILT